MYSSFDFTTTSSLSRNVLPSSRLDNVFVPSTSTFKLMPDSNNVEQYFKTFSEDNSMSSPPVHVSLHPGARIVLTQSSDFQPSLETTADSLAPPDENLQQCGATLPTKDDSCTDTDDDGHLIQRAMKEKEAWLKRQAKAKPIAVMKRRKLNGISTSGMTLKTLIDERIIQHGADLLTLDYRGRKETASIKPDGKIEWKGMQFGSPSAFSIHVKRTINPTRKADDGWKTVKYAGKHLEYYKNEFVKKKTSERKLAGPSFVISESQ